MCETIPLPGWDGAYLQSVLADRAGRVWVGDYGHGLWLVEAGQGRQIPAQQTGHNVVSLFEDSHGRVWIGGEQGIAIYDAGIFRVPEKDSGAPAGPVHFAEDAQGIVWTASREGVFYFQGGKFFELFENGRRIRNVNALLGDGAGALWIAPSHDDLLCYRRGTLARIDSAAGIPVGDIRSMLQDADGSLWMTSSRGIVHVRREELVAYADHRRGPPTVNIFDLKDGLPSLDFPLGTQPSCARDKKGRLWFATPRGAAMIDPKTLRLDPLPPPVDIQSLVYRKPARQAKTRNASLERDVDEVRVEGPFAQTQRLPAGSRSFEIRYAGLSFPAPSRVRYQVKLEPLDADWQDVGSQRLAYFRDLQPGEYVFHVQAANQDGVWNTQGASLAFTIEPYFWQTTWLRIVVSVGLVAIGAVVSWWLVRSRYRRQMELQLLRNELAHLSRVAIMGELSGSFAHELNVPLNAILLNAHLLHQLIGQEQIDRGEVKEIVKYIIDDDKRAAEIIQRTRLLLKKGEINQQPLDMNELVLEVLKLLRTDLVSRDVIVETQLEAGLPPVLGDRVQLQQVLVNLVINACDAVAANTDADRRIIVRTCRMEDGSIGTAVIDWGCGIPSDQIARVFEPFFTTKANGMGLGLTICRTIVAAHKGTLSTSNNSERGTTFQMTLKPAKGSS
jgi:signal transduction histidine kinase